MVTSVISAFIIVSAILYIALPIDTFRERASQEISGTQEDNWASFSDLSKTVQEAFNSDLENSIMQDILSLPISNSPVTDITIEELKDGETTIRWRAPEGDDVVNIYHLIFYPEKSCAGSFLATSETDTESVTIPIPDEAQSLAIQARFKDAVNLPTCHPLKQLPPQ